MADERTSGWLPPRAPGAKPPPRFDPPTAEEEKQGSRAGDAGAAADEWRPPRPAPTGPVFVPQPAQGGTNGLAVAGLVLGIVALGLLLLSLGLSFLFTLPLAIGAWVCAAQAKARIRDGRTHAGRGQAQVALWLGIAGVVLSVVAMIVWIVLIASGFSLEDFRQDLERELERQRNRDEVEAALVAAATLLRPP
jgi:hypothetical protein